MNYRELELLFKDMNYTLFKARDYRGVGYFIDNGYDTNYLGSSVKDIETAYIKYRRLYNEDLQTKGH